MRIEILYFAGCPNFEPALERVRQVAAALGVDASLEQVEIGSVAEAQHLRFPGSPTIRIDGRDVETGAAARGDFALSCRTYGGSGVPPREWIEAALRSALGAPR